MTEDWHLLYTKHPCCRRYPLIQVQVKTSDKKRVESESSHSPCAPESESKTVFLWSRSCKGLGNMWTWPSSGLGLKSDSTLFLSRTQISWSRLQHCLAYCSWVYMRRISYLQNITGRGCSSWKDLLYLHHWLHLWLNATWDAYSCTKKSRNHLAIL